MDVILLLKECSKKSSNYIKVWSFLISNINIEKDFSVSIFEISTKLSIPNKSVYRILNFGFNFLKDKNFEYEFYLKRNHVFIEYKTTKKNIKKDISYTLQTINENSEIVEIIIDYFNKKTNKNFSHQNKETIEIINNRLSEGFVLENFYYVIDLKYHQWKDTKFESGLRPKTLFGPNMESYINEKNIENNYLSENYEQAKRAIEYFEKGK